MKKKYKILKVDECFQCCRHFMADYNYKTEIREYACERKDFKTIPDPYSIPKWCPLENYIQPTKGERQ